MISRANTASIVGVEGRAVTVEADVSLGLPGLVLVGQVSGALNEAKERVKAALGHCGHPISPRKQVVNLAPADLRKDSPGIDLAVALALLAGHGIVPASRLERTFVWGELALDGMLRRAAGTLVVADCARTLGFQDVIVPHESGDEAAMIPGVNVRAAKSLPEVVAYLRGDRDLPCVQTQPPDANGVLEESEADLADICGLVMPRLALEVMVAGGHNLLFHGPPGVGKTMLARRGHGLMPQLSEQAALEVTKIYSVAAQRRTRGLLVRPPLRMPHHSVSSAGLLGGGSPPRPGEVSLAHRGLLFLDECPEYSRTCLEGLREPIEAGEVTIVRASGAFTFPARFQLLAAMNPCPCGYFGHPERACMCSAKTVARYQQRLSGPFLDRLDLVVHIGARRRDETLSRAGESSAVVRERIANARLRQAARFCDTPYTCNAEVPGTPSALAHYFPLTPKARQFIEAQCGPQTMSLRAQHRILRVARTLADLRIDLAEPGDLLGEAAIATALAMRKLPSL